MGAEVLILRAIVVACAVTKREENEEETECVDKTVTPKRTSFRRFYRRSLLYISDCMPSMSKFGLPKAM